MPIIIHLPPWEAMYLLWGKSYLIYSAGTYIYGSQFAVADFSVYCQCQCRELDGGAD